MYRQNNSSFCELKKLPDNNETRNDETNDAKDEKITSNDDENTDVTINISDTNQKTTYTNSAFDQINENLSEKNFANINKSSENDRNHFNDHLTNHEEENNCFEKLKEYLFGWYKTHSKRIKCFVKILIFLMYNVYLGFAVYLTWNKSPSYCHGTKLLSLITAFVYICMFIKIFFKPIVLKPLLKLIQPIFERLSTFKHTKKIIWALVWSLVIIFLVIDSSNNRYRLVSAFGLVCLIFMGFIFSAFRKKIIWHHIQCGILIQFVLSLLVLRWNVGRDFFDCLGQKIQLLLNFTDEGSGFVFGYLIGGKNDLQPAIFAFKVLTVVIFFSFLVSVLYYYGVMQVFIVNIGLFLQRTIGTTACESVNAAGSIFLGMTECPLLIYPYLPSMTKSELHAVMTGGFATIAGSVMASYIYFGVSASHLLSASVMSAPAALAFAKLMYPEVEESVTKAENIKMEKGKEKNALEAAINGITSGISLAVQIAASLVAFIAFIGLMNGLLSWFGSLVNWEFLTFEWLLSKLFVPLSLLMGVEWKDSENVAQLVGLKTIVNEFVAYKKLGDFKKENLLSARSEAIATFALCGFSNIGSIGIQLATLGSMAPERKSELATIAVRAMISGSAACFMTACIAGTLLTDFD